MELHITRRNVIMGICSALLLPATVVLAANNESYPYLLGDTTITIKVLKNGDGPTFVCLHDDENTARATATAIVLSQGGVRIELSHTGQRNISFAHQGVSDVFDPNRMWSDVGIKASLQALGGTYSDEAHRMVREFAQACKLFFQGGLLIAVHNNTNGSYNVSSYAEGGDLEREAQHVHSNPQHDTDDFFFVTTASFFDRLKERGFNVVLQARGATDDGSLSVYAARNSIAYVNVEAQDGHTAFQQTMLEALF